MKTIVCVILLNLFQKAADDTRCLPIMSQENLKPIQKKHLKPLAQGHFRISIATPLMIDWR